jgi:small subunit ribosomal protein S6
LVRDYEIVLIISPEVADDAIDGVIGKVKGFVANGGGEVTGVNVWGRRRIAFAIKHFRFGIYAVLNAKIDPAATKDLERSLRLSEDVIRHLLVRLEKPPVAPPPPPAPVEPVELPAEEPAKEQESDGGVTE